MAALRGAAGPDQRKGDVKWKGGRYRREVAAMKTRLIRSARRTMGRRRGLNIIDSLWGLALIGVGVVIVLGGGHEAWQLWKEFRGGYLHSRIVQATATTFRTTRNYGTVSLLASLDTFKRLPEAFVVRNASGVLQRVEHPWGDTVTVTGATNTFKVKFEDMDNDVCAAMAELTAGTTRSKSGLSGVTINTTAQTLPYTVATAATACNAGNGLNDVEWVYF